MQGDASNAFNEFERRPLIQELSLNPPRRSLFRVATMLYGRPSIMYVYDSSTVYYGPAMRIPSTRGVYKDCILGAMFITIVASRVHKKLAAIAPNKFFVCVCYNNGYISGSLASLVAVCEAMPAAYASVGLAVTIRRKRCVFQVCVSVMLSIIFPTATSCGEYMSPRKGRKFWEGQCVHPCLFVACSKRH
jgi:hypothetical protein